ncbi:hypothetical protein MKW98_023222 [Papaver atlanticum]|uniref:Single-stranded DNA-binding protein n=1 Tax=Papaver atlanticum TaxID=357466 RepID=A0AAD4TCZ7_9MAGN|nr:hypothetical protein MKW98_023222 [Papaver atlanticum]
MRNGRIVTIFTLGTGGMFDQRNMGAEPKQAQWHRIAVHNEHLGAYAVQQLVKGSHVRRVPPTRWRLETLTLVYSRTITTCNDLSGVETLPRRGCAEIF